jgi:hypothetical protein
MKPLPATVNSWYYQWCSLDIYMLYEMLICLNGLGTLNVTAGAHCIRSIGLSAITLCTLYALTCSAR